MRKYIAVSDFIKQDLVASGINAAKIDVVHNGIKIPEEYLADKIYMPHSPV